MVELMEELREQLTVAISIKAKRHLDWQVWYTALFEEKLRG